MMQPHIVHQFNSPAWRLEIDSVKDIIVVEIRDVSDKKVQFASIGLDDGHIYFNNLQAEERWLTGIEAAYDGLLLLHNYQSETGPAHKGLIAVDEQTGKTIWSDYNLAFDYLSINGPVLYDTRFQPKKLFLIDIKTGKIIRQHEPAFDLELHNALAFPEEKTREFTLALHLQVSPLQNGIHYLEHYNLRIVSLHAIIAGNLQQRLYLMRETDMIFDDLLNTDIQKLQPESFLLYKHYLIYLKNRSQLKVLNLNDV
ncbi:MAG: DUF4905 domain-containing protein [Bacteroidetes bacterium]|nr:DUF4905 domain-containing protein [Bacteroidota bacterium]